MKTQSCIVDTIASSSLKEQWRIGYEYVAHSQSGCGNSQ